MRDGLGLDAEIEATRKDDAWLVEDGYVTEGTSNNAYIVKKNEKILLMASVDKAEQEGNGKWHLVSIFGEQKRITGRINIMNLVNHEIIFEETDD